MLYVIFLAHWARVLASRGCASEFNGIEMLLENKNAVVYGAGGAIGGAVARAFASEGARVFLAGCGQAAVDRVAAEIARAGGVAEAAQLDALDERAVEVHAAGVAAQAGGIDISFTAISHGDVHGTPLLDMPYEEFARPVNNALRAQFLTTRAAARQMTKQRTGVIMAITATTARDVIPEVGGTGVAFDAIESLCRQWAAELGPLGIRVVWLQTTGIPEAFRHTGSPAPAYGTGQPVSGEEFVAWLKSKTMLDRLTTLTDVGHMAAFLASDRASAMTAAGVNLSCGSVPTR